MWFQTPRNAEEAIGNPKISEYKKSRTVCVPFEEADDMILYTFLFLECKSSFSDVRKQ